MPWAWPVIFGPRRRRHPGHQGVHQLVHRRRVQRVQGQRAPVPPGAEPGPGLAELGPGEHQHVDRQVADPVDEVVQEVQQPGVGVLGVLDQQHHRLHSPRAARRTAATRRTVPPATARPRRPPSDRDAEQAAQPGPDVGPLGRVGHEPVQPVGQLGRGDLGRVFLGDAQPLADDLGQRPERHPLAVGQAPAPVPPHLLGQAVGVLLELPAQPGLAHPGRAGDQHQPRHPPFRRGVEQLLDRAQLRVPAGQRRLQPVDPLDAAHPGQHPGRPPQPLRLRLALQPVLPGVGEPDRAGRQPLRRRVDQDLTRLRGRLDPGRGVHRVPGHHPLTDRAQRDRDLAGHHARPRRQPGHPRLGTQLGSPLPPDPARPGPPVPHLPRSAAGVPHTAITASPMNFSTTPP